MGTVMSDETKYKSAYELDSDEKAADHELSDVTTDELSPMVRKAIRRGEQALAEAAQANGAAYQNVNK